MFEYIKKKCNFQKGYRDLNWLNYGFRCIPFLLYRDLFANNFWYCNCKTRTFFITPEKSKPYTIISNPENCFYCWFLFLIKIKVKIIYKKKDNLVHLCSCLIEFFTLIDKFKHIYIRPNYDNIDKYEVSWWFNAYETFKLYFEANYVCLCCNKDTINF